jgi:hypothetical protein
MSTLVPLVEEAVETLDALAAPNDASRPHPSVHGVRR